MSDKPDMVHDWILSPTGKWYYYESPGLRIYASGTKYQEGKGIIASPPNVLITADNARDMQLAGQEAIKRDLVDGMREAVAKRQKLTVQEVSDVSVRKALGNAVMDAAMDKYSPGRTSAQRLAAELPGWLPDKRGVSIEDNKGNSLTAGSVEDMRALIALVRTKIAAVTGGMAQDAQADVPALPEARRHISPAQDAKGNDVG